MNNTPPLPKQSKALTPPARTIWTPPHSPDNEISHLADSFISVLQITDPKYDLTCFGEWFVGVPARLGTSEVLDKAADAFVAGLGGLRTGKQTVDSMVKYGKALTSLRATLMQPGTASSPHTLCAIFMIMVCQGWYSRTDDGSFSHMEGIAHLLNASAGQDWEDGFDATMRFNMIYPAVSRPHPQNFNKSRKNEAKKRERRRENMETETKTQIPRPSKPSSTPKSNYTHGISKATAHPWVHSCPWWRNMANPSRAWICRL